jgi:hypothetical protein
VPELERSYRTALEQLAALHLRSDKMRDRLHQAAKNGHRAIRIPLPDGIDLRKTDGAELFMDWAEENGLSVEWSSRVATRRRLLILLAIIFLIFGVITGAWQLAFHALSDGGRMAETGRRVFT